MEKRIAGNLEFFRQALISVYLRPFMIRQIGTYSIFILLLYSCGSGNKNSVSDSTDTNTRDTFNRKVDNSTPQIPVDSSLTAFSRFISGMNYPVQYAANKSAAWNLYSKGNTENWNVLESKIGGKIRQWVGQANLERKTDPGTLFYPFAGGDFYYPDLFFPNQDTVIMIGLEPCGSLFHPDKVNQDTLTQYYRVLQHSMFFPHKLGFFRTLSMKKDFNNTLLNGTLHTVLFYISKAGYDIHYIKFFNLDTAGSITGEKDAAGEKGRFQSYRIGYSRGGKGQVREVQYFSIDASDGGLRAKPGFINYMNRKKTVLSYFKAATYLMHYSSFSILRDYVLSHSARILQDDSGVPYKKLIQAGYKLDLYGNFTHTIPLFKAEFQPDLKDAYSAGSPAPVPFVIGYTAPDGECNLQHAIRNK